MSKHHNKQIPIGIYRLGNHAVELSVNPNMEGADFSIFPPRIQIGTSKATWQETVNVLLHEVFEFSLTAHNHRYEVSTKRTFDKADFLFVFDHSQFGRVCNDASMLLSE